MVTKNGFTRKKIHDLLNDQVKTRKEDLKIRKNEKKIDNIQKNSKIQQKCKKFRKIPRILEFLKILENSQNSEKCKIFSKILTNFLHRTPNR